MKLFCRWCSLDDSTIREIKGKKLSSLQGTLRQQTWMKLYFQVVEIAFSISSAGVTMKTYCLESSDEFRLTSKDVLRQLKWKAFVLVAEFHLQTELLLRHSQGNLNGCSRNIRFNKMLEHWKESQIFPFCPRRLQKPFHCALHVLWHSVKATSIFIYVSYLSFQ